MQIEQRIEEAAREIVQDLEQIGITSKLGYIETSNVIERIKRIIGRHVSPPVRGCGESGVEL